MIKLYCFFDVQSASKLASFRWRCSLGVLETEKLVKKLHIFSNTDISSKK